MTDVSSTGLWWLSFVDTTRSAPPDKQVPGGGGFLGCCIVPGPTFIQAVDHAHAVGCNPGGAVRGYPTGPPPHPAWMNRLLTATDVDYIDAMEDKVTAPGAVAERLGRGLWDRRPR